VTTSGQPQHLLMVFKEDKLTPLGKLRQRLQHGRCPSIIELAKQVILDHWHWLSRLQGSLLYRRSSRINSSTLLDLPV